MMIPTWAPQLLAGLAVAAACFAGGWSAKAVIADRDIAALQAQHAQAVAAAAQLSQAMEAQARAEESRRAADIERIARAEREAQQARAAAAVRTRAAAVSLRDAARAATDALAAEAARDPGAAERGETTAGPGLVLADVLGALGERLADMAATADDARARGIACERAYDALTERTGE